LGRSFLYILGSVKGKRIFLNMLWNNGILLTYSKYISKLFFKWIIGTLFTFKYIWLNPMFFCTSFVIKWNSLATIHESKPKNTMQITQSKWKKNYLKLIKTIIDVCFRISNHQKWLEITQFEIIFYTLNIWNYIHIRIGSKLTYFNLLFSN